MIDHPEQEKSFASDSGAFRTASSVLDTALILENKSGQRVATSFVVTVPFSQLIGGREYFHVYAVTARHCTSTRDGHPHRLTAQCSWIGDVGVISAELNPSNWSTIRCDELCRDDGWVDEAWIDIAVQRLDSGLYSDAVVGRSIRAVRADRFLTFRRESYSDVSPIDLPTLTVGLLQFVLGDPTRLEPMAHFGRLAMVPVGTVEGAWGQMAAYLVESSASRGMSGAPVFAQLETGDYQLLGVHVGHFKERQESLGGHKAKPSPEGKEAPAGGADTESSKAREDDEGQGSTEGYFAMHSQVGLVAPAYKILQILDTQTARDSRALVESAVRRSCWRFLDRCYRQRAGVCRPEVLYDNLADYESSHPYDENFLILRPTDEQWLSERGEGDGFEPWSQVEVGALGTADEVVSAIQKVAGVTSPVRKSLDGTLLHLSNEGHDVTLYRDESNGIEAIELSVRAVGSDRKGVYELARALNGIVQDLRCG